MLEKCVKEKYISDFTQMPFFSLTGIKMFSSLWETAKVSPFKRTHEVHCDAPNKELVSGRTISAASTGVFPVDVLWPATSFILLLGF